MNASDLTLIQRGERRYLIEKSYRYLPHHPSTLFTKIAREAILNLSNNPDPTAISSEAARAFLSAAMQPGLDIRGVDPYKLSQDFCATLRTVLEYISRTTLLTLHHAKDTEVSGLPWSFSNPADDTGTFHRWVFVDSIDESTIYHHIRSWEVYADIAIASVPLQLHLIAIGRTEKGRRISPWCRTFVSPTIAHQYRFKRKTGELQGDWRPVWYADSTRNKPNTWVDLMESDGILDSLTYNVTVSEPSPTHRNRFLSIDLPYLTSRINAISGADPFLLPMCRNSCDLPYPCPHEPICYSSTPSTQSLSSSPLYTMVPTRQLKPARLG